MADSYQEAKLVPEDVAVLEEIESIMGEPIPKMKDSINLKFGFVAKSKRVISLGLAGKGINSLPDSLGNLTELRELFLSNNNLQSLPESFTDLRKLNKLDFWNNNLKEESFNEKMTFLTQLHYLEIRGNKGLKETNTYGDYHENSFQTKNHVKSYLNRFRK